MFVLGNFLNAVAVIVHYVLQVYMWIVIARAVLSWVNPDPYNPIVQFVHNLTEPVMLQIRKRLPVVAGGMDLSPIIIFLAIIFLDAFLVSSLQMTGQRLMMQR